jgi:colicin import membrane protein
LSGYEDKVKEEAKAEQDNATKYIQDDIKKAEAKLANLETQKKESESVSADKIKQFEEIEKTKIPEPKKQLESINSEIKSVKDPSSDEGKKKIAELTSKKNALESQIKTAETSVANFKDRNKNIDKEISEAKKNIEELKKKEAEAKAKAKAKAEADAKAKAEAEANAKKASASTSSPKTAATNKPAESPTTTEAVE